MPLSDKLLEKLVCPGCKNKLTYDETNDKLNCETCQLAYKVNNEVPVLLADEAEKL